MEIDDSFYNRQRYVLGDNAMKLLSQSSIYLYGLQGLGIEIAKNLVLGGIKEIYLDDVNVCQLEDMGSQFYITKKDVKNKLTRAQASLTKLSQLNPYVNVCLSPFTLNNLSELMKTDANKPILDNLEKFSCIVLSGCDLVQIGIINNFCRSKDIRMVVADVLGLLGIIFCDFGDNFVIQSENDEENVEFFIGYVGKSKNPILKVLNDESHGLKTGDVVTFKDVHGMIELNGKECEIIVETKSTIRLKLDSSNWSFYTKNGICIQKKVMKTLHFNNFYDQCFKPTIINPDFCKQDSSRSLQLLYLSLRHFRHTRGRMPSENSESDFHEIQKHLNKLNVHFDELNADCWSLIEKLCFCSSGELPPLSALFGGIAAQEAIKAVTQQFTPIQQWFVMECECLAYSKPDIDKPITRYENLRKCVGMDLLNTLHNLRIFMVGCGAIGCELLKNMAMLGISASEHKKPKLCSDQLNNCGTINSRIESCGDALFSSTAEADEDTTTNINTYQSTDLVNVSDRGPLEEGYPLLHSDSEALDALHIASNYTLKTDKLTQNKTDHLSKIGRIIITDNDLIEKSNLNRQFLFKECHIKQPKSVIARQSILQINPDMNIEAHQNFVGASTENIYSDFFFQNIDICLNALDNLDSRKYMDNRCVINEKCLIESGTMSTKGHVQVIIPYLTENYSNQNDPQEKEIPYCTLKSFPAKIEHCIEWAREKFELNFLLKPSASQRYLSTMDQQGMKLNCDNPINYEDLVKSVKFLRKRPNSYRECVQFVRVKFEILFNHKARQLLHCFPLNTKLDDGTYFWQLPRRPPNPIKFDLDDPLHFQFIYSYSNMLASVYGIEVTDCNSLDLSTYQTWIDECSLPIFVPSDKSIETDENVNPEDKKSSNVKDEDLEICETSIIELLKSMRLEDLNAIQPIEFDKDNGLHIECIHSLSNLRCRMYSIEEVDIQTSKRISGRIIPAIATTTSVVAGLVIIELLKLAKKCQFFDHRNSFLNLSLSQFVLSEPGNCPYEFVVNNRGEKFSFSLWAHWNVVGNENFTIRDFIADLEKQKSLTVNMILQGSRIIYLNILPGSKNKLDLKMNPMLVTNEENQYVDLLVSYTNPCHDPTSDDTEDVKGPRIRYWLNKNVLDTSRQCSL